MLVGVIGPLVNMQPFDLDSEPNNDIYYWDDGFWCLRKDLKRHAERLLRDPTYRLIEHDTDAWRAFTKVIRIR